MKENLIKLDDYRKKGVVIDLEKWKAQKEAKKNFKKK